MEAKKGTFHICGKLTEPRKAPCRANLKLMELVSTSAPQMFEFVLEVLHKFSMSFSFALQSTFLGSIYKLSKSVKCLKLLGFHAHDKTFNLPNSKRMIVSYITRTGGKLNLQIKKSKITTSNTETGLCALG